MAMILSLYVLFLLVPCCIGTKLNVPKLLLPYYSEVATNSTLEVADGCYVWTSSRPDVASVVPLDVADSLMCSRRALVTVRSKDAARRTSIVIAQEEQTGHKLQCDIIVDKMASIELETTTKELFLEDSPEQFVMKGHDSEGNVFSSLQGIVFDWTLISESENALPGHHILRIIPHSESSYETPPYLKSLENRGKNGDMILVEGIRTGSAKVRVQLLDQAYPKSMSTEVRLVVVANIMLNPPIAYVLVQATIQYQVELIRQGRSEVIKMPSRQYKLNLENDSIAQLDDSTSTVTALALGNTDIVLSDLNIKLTHEFHQPSASVYVVEAAYIGFVVLPVKRFILETEKEYDIEVQIFDHNSRKLYPSKNMRVTVEFPEEHFEVLKSSSNGIFHHVHTLKRGRCTLRGTLHSLVGAKNEEYPLDPPVSGQQELEIFDPITVTPSHVYFPWLPQSSLSFSYQLQAQGGSGNYTWSSSDLKVADVSKIGIVQSSQIGEASVRATDVRNSAAFGKALIHVLKPDGIRFKDTQIEAEVGNELRLPLAMFTVLGGKKKEFADCHALKFYLTLKEDAPFEHVEGNLSPLRDGCVGFLLKARQHGHTEVKAIYHEGALELSASIVVAAYRPLKAVDPMNIAVIALGTSRDIVFQGGPLPWVLDTSKFFQNLIDVDEKFISVTSVKGRREQKGFHTFHVTCNTLDEQDITAIVGNRPSARNKRPANSTASITLTCASPVGLTLSIPLEQPKSCPCVSGDEPTSVLVSQVVPIVPIVTDQHGRPFDNTSSLNFDWELNNDQLATLRDKDEVKVMVHQPGLLVVTAKIDKYKDGATYLKSIISAAIEINVISAVALDPPEIDIFNHATNKAAISVIGGSGYFDLQPTSDASAELAYDSITRKIVILPLQDGSMTIRVKDLCVSEQREAQSKLVISGIGLIDMSVIDQVQIYHTIIADVQVFDTKGDQLPVGYFPVIGLGPVAGSSIITVRPDVDAYPDPFTARFLVLGVELGRTSLQFVATTEKKGRLSSVAQDIQVFPPLRLEPRNNTLLVGAVFQVSAYGGPQPQSQVKFSIGDDNISGISYNGLLDAKKPGHTIVTGQAISYGSGQRTVHSEDQVYVHVVQLSGIRIWAPLKRIQAGQAMPLHIMGLDENETPFNLATEQPALNVKWMCSSDSAYLVSLFHHSGFGIHTRNNLIVQLKARRPGVLMVTAALNASELQIIQQARLVDQLQVEVFEPLVLISPDLRSTEALLVTSNSDFQVKTSRDASAKLFYRVENPGLASVSSSGKLQTGDKHGLTTVVVTAQEEWGANQTLVISVEVAMVSYIMLSSQSRIHRVTDLQQLPTGFSFHFIVSSHDVLGRNFSTTDSVLRWQLSRHGLAHASLGSNNHSIIVSTSGSGMVMLKVWEESRPSLVDYATLDIADVLWPTGFSLHMGEVLCLGSAFSGSDISGQWSSDEIIEINQQGVGLAVEPGKGRVLFSAGEQSTQTEIIIRPLTAIFLSNNNVNFFTNVLDSANEMEFTVHLEQFDKSNVHGDCPDDLAFVSANTKAFICKLISEDQTFDVNQLFEARPLLNPVTRLFVCDVQPIRFPELSQKVAALYASISLQVHIPASDFQPQIDSQAITLPFAPAFHLLTSSMTLTDVMSVAKIRLIVSKEVRQSLVARSYDQSIKTHPIELNANRAGESVIPISLDVNTLRGEHMMKVEIISTMTNQVEKVILHIKVGNVQHTNWQPSIYFLTAVIGILIAFLIFLAFMYLTSTKLRPTTQMITQTHTPSQTYVPSPWNSPYAGGISPGRIRLWTSGYDNNASGDRTSPNLQQSRAANTSF